MAPARFFGRYRPNLLPAAPPGCAPLETVALKGTVIRIRSGLRSSIPSRDHDSARPETCDQRPVLQTRHANRAAGDRDGGVERDRAGDGVEVRARRGGRAGRRAQRTGRWPRSRRRWSARAGGARCSRRTSPPPTRRRDRRRGARALRRLDDAGERRGDHRLRLGRIDDRRAVGRDDGHQPARAVPADARRRRGALRRRRDRSSTCRA